VEPRRDSQYRFWDGDRRLTSVTGLISAIGVVKSWDGQVPQAVLDNAALRGKQTETLCYELLVEGSVDVPDDVVPGVYENVLAFDRWRLETSPEYVAHSKIFMSKQYGIAGEVDLITKSALIDLKTSSQIERESSMLQVGGYVWLSGSQGDCGILHLNKKYAAGYRWVEFDTSQAESAWEWAIKEYKAESYQEWEHARKRRLEVMSG